MASSALQTDSSDDIQLVAPQAPDRLPAMLFLAALFHGILIIGGQALMLTLRHKMTELVAGRRDAQDFEHCLLTGFGVLEKNLLTEVLQPDFTIRFDDDILARRAILHMVAEAFAHRIDPDDTFHTIIGLRLFE